MKTLMLLRHAKSSWDDPDLADHDRPLNERGQRDARRIGRVIAERGITPDTVICSTALRALQTAEAVKEAAGFTVEIIFDPRIYEASTGRLIEVVGGMTDEAGTGLLVGHNSGMETLVHRLTGRLEPMPTAALAVIRLNVDRWGNAAAGAVEMVEIIRPKEL